MRLIYTQFLTPTDPDEGTAIDHEAVSGTLLQSVPDGAGYGAVDATLLREKYD
jgi:hypothetical protein